MPSSVLAVASGDPSLDVGIGTAPADEPRDADSAPPPPLETVHNPPPIGTAPSRVFPITFLEHILRFDMAFPEGLEERLPEDEFVQILTHIHQTYAQPLEKLQKKVRKWTLLCHSTAVLAVGFLLTPVLARHVHRLQSGLKRFWLSVKAHLKRLNRDIYLARGVELRVTEDREKVVNRSAFNALMAFRIEILFRRPVQPQQRLTVETYRPAVALAQPAQPSNDILSGISDLDHFVFDDRPLAQPDRKEPAVASQEAFGPVGLAPEEHANDTDSPEAPYLHTVPVADLRAMSVAEAEEAAVPLNRETRMARQTQLSAVPEEEEAELLDGKVSLVEPLPETRPSLSFAEALALARAREEPAGDAVPAAAVAAEEISPPTEISSPVNETTTAASADASHVATVAPAVVAAELVAESTAPADGPIAPAGGAAAPAHSLAHDDAFNLRQKKKLERAASLRASASHVPSIAGFSHLDPFSALYETDQFVPLSRGPVRGPDPIEDASLDVDVEEEEVRAKKFRVMPDSPAARLSQAFQSTRESLQPASRRSSFLPSITRNTKSMQLFGSSADGKPIWKDHQ